MHNNNKKNTGIYKIRSMPFSLKLNISLLIIIALASILGTIIPQGNAAGKFAMHLMPWTLSLFNSLGLFDVYHSI